MSEVQLPAILKADEKFYFEDGDVVFQVENQLFKIHRFLIERNSPVLKNVLSLEYKSDEEIIPYQDSAENFRTLCWMLYATPREIYAAQRGDIKTIMQVSSVAHKYGVKEFESWVEEVFSERLEGMCCCSPPLNQI